SGICRRLLPDSTGGAQRGSPSSSTPAIGSRKTGGETRGERGLAQPAPLFPWFCGLGWGFCFFSRARAARSLMWACFSANPPPRRACFGRAGRHPGACPARAGRFGINDRKASAVLPESRIAHIRERARDRALPAAEAGATIRLARASQPGQVEGNLPAPDLL